MNVQHTTEAIWPAGGLRRALIVSFALHVVFFVSVALFGGPHFHAPKRTEVIPGINLVAGLPAPPAGQMKRQDAPAVASLPAARPAKAPEQPKKPVSDRTDRSKVAAKPPVKYPEKSPPQSKEKTARETESAGNKVGSAESSPVQRSELPAVGNLRGWMQTQVEGPILAWSYYIEILQTKIASYWEPPADLAATAGESAVVVYFRIDQDGSMRNPYVEEPSGQSLFDTSALRAVTQAAPFPPLPEEYPGDHLILHLRFVYAP